MADNARPPVAIRIVRPYETEEAFLESELETVGKTSIILIGAHARPTGVILRFEVTLASGATVLRGEGRVLAHKESAFRGQAGLALRFTRLDPKSKALVDRAAAIREARLSGEAPSMHPPPSSSSAAAPLSSSAPEPASASAPTPDPALAEILTSSTSPPPPSALVDAGPSSLRAPDADAPVARAPEAACLDPEAPAEPLAAASGAEHVPAIEEASPTSIASAPEEPRPAPPARDRDALLARLRERAASMSEERIASILRSTR